MTKPQQDPQVAEALKDLGWGQAEAIFGDTTNVHCLQAGTRWNEFTLAPIKASKDPCSFDTADGTAGFEFQQFLCKF